MVGFSDFSHFNFLNWNLISFYFVVLLFALLIFFSEERRCVQQFIQLWLQICLASSVMPMSKKHLAISNMIFIKIRKVVLPTNIKCLRRFFLNYLLQSIQNDSLSATNLSSIFFLIHLLIVNNKISCLFTAYCNYHLPVFWKKK